MNKLNTFFILVIVFKSVICLDKNIKRKSYYYPTNFNRPYLIERNQAAINYLENLTPSSVEIVEKIPAKISEKFWNVPAPYIPPNENLLEDVSFSIGIVLTVFVFGVIFLGVAAGILSKPNSGRSFDHYFYEEIFNGIAKFAELNSDYNN